MHKSPKSSGAPKQSADQDGRDRPRHEALTSRILNVCQPEPLTQAQIAERTGELLTRVCNAMKRLKSEGRLDLVGTLGKARHAPKLWRAFDRPASVSNSRQVKPPALTARILTACKDSARTNSELMAELGETYPRIRAAVKQLRLRGWLGMENTTSALSRVEPRLWRTIPEALRQEQVKRSLKSGREAGGNGARTRQNALEGVKVPSRTVPAWREYREPVAMALALLRCLEARKLPSRGAEG